ncbi:MAG: hypothetical protein ACK4N5_07145, partial [Myxococcales bacterium]
ALRLTRCSFIENSGAGLVVVDGAATVERTLFRANTSAVHVQGRSRLEEVSQVQPEPAADTVSVSRDSEFIINRSRVGVGEVHLPDPLQP